MRTIGISGKAEAGKDTVAGIITTVYPETVVRRAFADRLKREALAVWAETRRPHLQWVVAASTDAQLLASANLLKSGNAEFRTFLQEYGQSRRAEDPLYWIRACAEDHLASLADCNKVLVVPDVRYSNEAGWVLANDGLLLRVERPGHVNGLTDAQRAHPSETALDDCEDFHAILENRDFLGLLRDTLAVVRPWLARRGE